MRARFVATYQAAGGAIDNEIFSGAEPRWINHPGPQTDRVIAMIKVFIACQLPVWQLVG